MIASAKTVDRIMDCEQFIQSRDDTNLKLFLRERRPDGPVDQAGTPLLLIHGATIASVLWDNPISEWSWMNRLASDGFHVFALDLRGYGRSTRPTCFDLPPDENTPYARAADVQKDVVDAIHYILEQTASDQIDLLGGSWGSIVCGKLAAEADQSIIRKLVLYAPLYCDANNRPSWLDLDVIDNPSGIGAYRRVSLQQMRDRWDAEIPVCEKVAWRASGVLEAMVNNCLSEEMEQSGSRSDSFKVPNGTIADLQQAFTGNPLYECEDISTPVMLIRGSHDPVSTHEDASQLFTRISSDIKRYTIIGNGAHFMIAEKKFGEVHTAVAGFLLEKL